MWARLVFLVRMITAGRTGKNWWMNERLRNLTYAISLWGWSDLKWSFLGSYDKPYFHRPAVSILTRRIWTLHVKCRVLTVACFVVAFAFALVLQLEVEWTVPRSISLMLFSKIRVICCFLANINPVLSIMQKWIRYLQINGMYLSHCCHVIEEGEALGWLKGC